MTVAPSLSRLHSPFLCAPLKPNSSASLSVTFSRNQRSPSSYPRIRALDLDQNTVPSSSTLMIFYSFPKIFHALYLIEKEVKMKIEVLLFQVVALSVGLVSVAVGIGIPVFYETQIDNSAKRENTQPCFPCSGSGAQKCRFCLGTGNVTVELGGDEKEVSRCINCDGVGTFTCTTCQGSGIQPRYLDRREFKDDD